VSFKKTEGFFFSILLKSNLSILTLYILPEKSLIQGDKHQTKAADPFSVIFMCGLLKTLTSWLHW
jgi:hypothetical protein